MAYCHACSGICWPLFWGAICVLRIVLFLVPPLLWTGLPVGRVTSGAGLGWGLESSMVGLTSGVLVTEVGEDAFLL